MASKEANEWVSRRLGGGPASISSMGPSGEKRFPAPGELPEPPPERSFGKRALEAVVPSVAATMLGGPAAVGAARLLGAAPSALPAIGLAGETVASGGAGALQSLMAGEDPMAGAAMGAGGNLVGAGIGGVAGRMVPNIPGLRALMDPTRLPVVGQRLGRSLQAGAREADQLLAGRGDDMFQMNSALRQLVLSSSMGTSLKKSRLRVQLDTTSAKTIEIFG